MNDKELGALFMTHLAPAMQASPDLYGVGLARNFQASQQGAATGPYAYFSKLFDHKFGYPERVDEWNAAAGAFVHSEIQDYETTFQITAWVPQSSKDVTALTESDILNAVSGIMQSDSLLAAFKAAGVGVLRVADVSNPYIVDDRDRFEAVPSFDVVLLHKRKLVSTIPAVVTYSPNISRV